MNKYDNILLNHTKGLKMNIGEAAKYVGRKVQTLQVWDRKGILKPASRTATNRRVYTKQQLDTFLGKRPNENERKIVVYCRVSSSSQKSDLKNQVEASMNYCIAKGYCNTILVEEIGDGLNFKRKKLLELFSQVQRGEISKIIITHKDRLCRFGFDFLDYVCKENNCELEVINFEQTSPEKEVVEDLMAIIHCFSCRLYGLRKYAKVLKDAIKK